MFIEKLVDYNNQNSFGSKLRHNRSLRVVRIVERICEKYGSCRILDLGGTYVYWKVFPSNWFERYKIQITLLNLQAVPIPEERTQHFRSVQGNACMLKQFDDREFDLVHSNSVIEHVGSWENMSSMASESIRVGKFLYHQTPYFWFPVEPHFLFPLLHWLPLPIRVKLAQRIALGNWPKAESLDAAIAAQTSAVLLDKSMMESLFRDARIEFEHFCCMPKSIIAYTLPMDNPPSSSTKTSK